MAYLLSSESPTPLYIQLQDSIRSRVSSGEFSANELIPSELKLQEIYGVSRITVRKAVEHLVLEGVLLKKRGIGTVVASLPYEDIDLDIKGFTEKSADQDVEVTTQVLTNMIIPASNRIANKLNIVTGTNVIFVRRLRYSSGEAICLFENYLPLTIGIPENYDFSGSIYHLIEKICKKKIGHVEKEITAINIGQDDALLLKIATGDAALVMRNTTRSEQGQVVDYSEGLYRTDKYNYHVHLDRRG